MKIVVDVFGGDNSPHAQVKASIDYCAEFLSDELVLSGDEGIIREELKKYNYDTSRITVLHAPEVITNDDSPANAIRAKKDSSLVKACDLLKNDETVSAMVSSGSTGAVLAGSMFRVGRMKGVLRPALAPLLPTRINDKLVCLIDCGANVDSKPEYLRQFALMGVCYMKAVRGVENPRVGLVSVGVEDHKGNELTKAVFPMLKELPINFAGNMEARDALTGEYDVLVSDGFAGNVLLKSVEGAAQMVMGELKAAIMGSASAKLGSLFMKTAFKKLKNKMDYNKYGGAPFLGIEKPVVKAHGAATADAFLAALKQVRQMAAADLCGAIKAELEKVGGVETAN